MAISPFGWHDTTAPYITAVNLEAMLASAGAYVDALQAQALLKTDNLASLNNAVTARTNLGLGSAATQAASAFDTAGVAATEQTRALAAESLLAPQASATFTGTVTVPTPPPGTNNTQAASTAFVGSAITGNVAVLNPQSGSYTPILSDAGATIEVNSASAAVITVPANVSVPFPIGTTLEVAQIGIGPVSIAPAASVTLEALNGVTQLSGQYAVASLTKVLTNTWLLAGGLGTGGGGGGGGTAGQLPATGTTGAPTAGAWSARQLALDSNNGLWKCLISGTPGTWERFNDSVTPQDFGALGDAIWVIDGAMTNGSSTLACATSLPFTSTAVDNGKLICIPGAGTAGAVLVSTISSVTDTGHAVLANTASATVSGKTVVFGTDDTAALRTWMAALSSTVIGLVTGRHMTAIGTTTFNLATRPGLTIRSDGGGRTIPASTITTWNNPHLVSFPNAAIVNTASGSTSFFTLTDSHFTTFDGVAIMNANSAYIGKLLDWSPSVTSCWSPTVRNAYIGGVDGGCVGAAGQMGLATDRCSKGIISDCVFGFIDIPWQVAINSANSMTARDCMFVTYGTVAVQNPGEATQLTNCEFALTWASGTVANQRGAALNHQVAYQGWDASCTFLNCHFTDVSVVGSNHWITAGNPAGQYGGLVVLGGYWGGGTGDYLVFMDAAFDSIYIVQSGSGSPVPGGGGAAGYNANGKSVRSTVVVGG